MKRKPKKDHPTAPDVIYEELFTIGRAALPGQEDITRFINYAVRGFLNGTISGAAAISNNSDVLRARKRFILEAAKNAIETLTKER